MKILPVMCREIVWLREDGKSFDRVPFQVFEAEGRTLIRIGRNLLRFTENGTLAGNECKVVQPLTPSEEQTLTRAFDETGALKDLAPQTPYFHPETIGHEYETADWARAPAHSSEQAVTYTASDVDKKTLN